MKKIIEYVIYSFYILSKKYEYRTGKSTEVSTVNFLSAVFTFILLDIFLYVCTVLLYFFYRSHKINNPTKFIFFIILMTFFAVSYFSIKKQYDLEYVRSVFLKYDNQISKTKAVFIMIIAFLIIPLSIFLTAYFLNITTAYIRSHY